MLYVPNSIYRSYCLLLDFTQFTVDKSLLKSKFYALIHGLHSELSCDTILVACHLPIRRIMARFGKGGLENSLRTLV